MEFVETRTKVHHLDEGYACVPKMRDFTEAPKEEVWGHQSFRVKEVFLRSPTFLLRFKRYGFFLFWFISTIWVVLREVVCIDALRGYLVVLDDFNSCFTARL